MAQAVFSPTTKLIYTGAQAALSVFQRYSPENQNLIIGIQRVAMVMDALYLVSDYKDLYDGLSAKYEARSEQDKKWYHHPNTLLAIGMVVSVSLSAVHLNLISRKPNIDLSKLVTPFDPHMPVDWVVPTMHKVSMWLISSRHTVNCFMMVTAVQYKTLLLMELLATMTVVNMSKLRWIQIEKPVSAYLFGSNAKGSFQGRAYFTFLMPACKNAKDHLSTTVQAAYDYVKDSFKHESWSTSIIPGLWLKRTVIHASIVAPAFTACACKLQPILTAIAGGSAMFDGKPADFTVGTELQVIYPNTVTK